MQQVGSYCSTINIANLLTVLQPSCLVSNCRLSLLLAHTTGETISGFPVLQRCVVLINLVRKPRRFQFLT